jgi:hypothetical protein
MEAVMSVLAPDPESQPWPRRSLWPAQLRQRDPDVARRGAALCRALLAARVRCGYDSEGRMIHGPACSCEPEF